MLLHKLESLKQYLRFLHENRAEPAALCEDILIHVTGFFREPEAFQALADRVFPKILDSKPPGESIRVGDAYEDRTSVGEQVIDTVRDRDADGVGTEIVIIDAFGRAIPLHPVVLEVADQFSFFGIDADHGKPLTLKAGTQRGDVSELLVAVRARVGGNGLAIHAEGEIHVAKQSRYCSGRNLDIELPQQFSDSGRRLVGPANAGDGVAGGVVFQ